VHEKACAMKILKLETDNVLIGMGSSFEGLDALPP
jgi:hypothetical protein